MTDWTESQQESRLEHNSGRISTGASPTSRAHPNASRVGISRLRLWRAIDGLALTIAPSLAAAAVLLAAGGSVGAAGWMLVAMFGAASILKFDGYPIHLMPVARTALHVFVPLMGAVVFALPGILLFGPWLDGALLALAAAGVAIATRIIGDWALRTTRRRLPLRIAIVGRQQLSTHLRAELADRRLREYDIVGYVDAGGADGDPCETRLGTACLGSIDNLRSVVSNNEIDILAIDHALPEGSISERIAAACLDRPVRAIGYNQLHEDLVGYVPIGSIDSAWFQYMMHPRYTMGLRPWSKRAFDIVVGGLMAIPASLLIGILGLLVKAQDGGPAFYTQDRVGEGGRIFKMPKLRTMSVHAQDGSALRLCGANDPRITPIGRILRSTHLDELPQVFSVLRGDMTFVGPRPVATPVASDMEGQVPFYARRALVRPGLTGWGGVACGYGSTLARIAWSMAHDLYYLKRRSLVFDMMILLETSRTVLFDEQAAHEPPADDLLLGEEGAKPERLSWLPGQEVAHAGSR